MSGVNNPTFDEIDRNLRRHSLRISLDLKDSIEASENEQQCKKSIKAEENYSSGCLVVVRNTLQSLLQKYQSTFKIFGLTLLNLLLLIYFAFATAYWIQNSKDCQFEWCDGYGMLLLLFVFSYGGLLYYKVVKRHFGKWIKKCFRPLRNCLVELQNTKYGCCISQSVVYLSILVAAAIFLIFDTTGSRNRLISASGVLILILLGWIFSKHPGNIKWRTVICGLILQFIFGLITIRWTLGRSVFKCLSNKVATFLNYSIQGTTFVFGEQLIKTNVFAFSVIPIIYFFGFIIQILYYLGVMQWVILKLGCTLQTLMGTTLCESLNCAANTFVGMTESALLIKPYVSKLTSSELHTIMCSGFATVSGTVLAAYISFGAQPVHLLTASVMAAPATLCFSKLFYPETEISSTCSKSIQLEKSEDTSILDAASKGALAGIPMVLGIIANIVAFVSFIAFINAFLGWAGSLVGYEELSFELILSKVFMPLSWIMGVPWDDCDKVATLIGLKSVINEFVAYQKLGEFKNAGSLSGRSEAIATYAICGFANPSSVGIMIGGLSSLAPEKRGQITSVTVRAFIAGSVVCFMTASMAGMLMDDAFFTAANVSTSAV
ncbi:uncharacterized transporter YutK [Prorops nasuta]|uniref:uncharacterized transporter YutK n=1 Tax=Prorops nasuta TaxID=863751 RepID=UPI0034CD94EF